MLQHFKARTITLRLVQILVSSYLCDEWSDAALSGSLVTVYPDFIASPPEVEVVGQVPLSARCSSHCFSRYSSPVYLPDTRVS